MDGAGKGAIAVVMALSFITGKALLGEHVWRIGPVAIITYEDDETEWKRRIAAACIHYGIDYESVIGSFHFFSRPGSRVCLAAPSVRGNTMFPDGAAIIDHLNRIKAVLLIVDPFNHAHALEDGNNNAMIAKVAGELTRIAQLSSTAVLVLHHLRKGAIGDPDDLMGAVVTCSPFFGPRGG
jgi:RecA-family ATPase